MNAAIQIPKKLGTRALLSTLWVVVMINMLKADILSLYIPGTADELAAFAGQTPIPLIMLGAAIMMEISIVMIVLSQVLKPRVNRWVNIIVATVTIAFIVLGRSSYPHYTFIAAVEIVSLLLIVWIAWWWSDQDERLK